MRKIDGVYKDAYALHCYRLALQGEKGKRGDSSMAFDVCAGLPGGRWGDVWRDVRDLVEGPGFEEIVRGAQEMARGEFGGMGVREFLKDPQGWARGVKGPLEKVEVRVE